MIWEAIATTLGTKSILDAIKARRNRLSERKSRELLAAAVAELLELDPNINSAEAKIRAAEALGLPPSTELVTALDVLEKVKSHKAEDRPARIRKETTGKEKSGQKGKEKSSAKSKDQKDCQTEKR